MFDILAKGIAKAFAIVVNLTACISLTAYAPQYLTSCNRVQQGGGCRPEISQYWGQYSPWFSAASEIQQDIPQQCIVTFAQILSRHGGRYPTANKTVVYHNVIHKIHQMVHHYGAEYAFIKDYQYSLGADHLTLSGEQEMIDSGVHFFERYHQLSVASTPFVRASSQQRVVQSAQNWTQGFHLAKSLSHTIDPDHCHSITVISEADGSNNTLDHGLCKYFEEGLYSETGASAQADWSGIFIPPIQARLNLNLPGANLSAQETIYMMDLCPFDTIASPTGATSAFCELFTEIEWQQYDYYQSLGKYYGYGAGNLLGPTQGVGFINELIARLTNMPVQDHTSTNRTLDRNPYTFPLGRTLYADFSHDNVMTSIFFALGLYNSTQPLSNATVETIQETSGYSAAYTVLFASRAYIEKLRCTDFPEEDMIRVLVNDRVMPLQTCGGDCLGRCSLSNFVNSLTFATQGGHWDQCFPIIR